LLTVRISATTCWSPPPYVSFIIAPLYKKRWTLIIDQCDFYSIDPGNARKRLIVEWTVWTAFQQIAAELKEQRVLYPFCVQHLVRSPLCHDTVVACAAVRFIEFCGYAFLWSFKRPQLWLFSSNTTCWIVVFCRHCPLVIGGWIGLPESTGEALVSATVLGKCHWTKNWILVWVRIGCPNPPNYQFIIIFPIRKSITSGFSIPIFWRNPPWREIWMGPNWDTVRDTWDTYQKILQSWMMCTPSYLWPAQLWDAQATPHGFACHLWRGNLVVPRWGPAAAAAMGFIVLGEWM
jgi:hypothetical protein